MNTVQIALMVQNCSLGGFDANLTCALAMAKKAAASGAKIVVFPEMNLTGYCTGKSLKSMAQRLDDHLLGPVTEVAQKLGISLLTGVAEKADDTRIYATQLVFFPDGTWSFYRKVHTAPFEKRIYTAGSDIPVFKAAGLTFGVQLCYDAHFPELSRAMALSGADIIFIPHASPRGTPEEKYRSWLRHLTARAFDNGVYIAACNQAGDNGAGMSFPAFPF